MSTKYTMYDEIKKIEHKFVRQWLRGTGEHAKFEQMSAGYYAVFASCPASVYLGSEAPALEAGDRVKLTLERV